MKLVELFDNDILDVPTPTVEQIATKFGVSEEYVRRELKIGIHIELEHTSDLKTAKEIALDHLNERPDYYTALSRYVEETTSAGSTGAGAVASVASVLGTGVAKRPLPTNTNKKGKKKKKKKTNEGGKIPVKQMTISAEISPYELSKIMQKFVDPTKFQDQSIGDKAILTFYDPSQAEEVKEFLKSQGISVKNEEEKDLQINNASLFGGDLRKKRKIKERSR